MYCHRLKRKGNSLLLFANRASNIFKKKERNTLLPHENKVDVKEAIIVLDTGGFLYPNHNPGVMNNEIAEIAENLYKRYQSYFSSIKPTTYYGDICSKNIMISNGVFSGLVDLDGLTQGDPLEAIGRIKLSWYDTRHGDLYSTAIMDELGLNREQRHLATMYALLNQISWACENGIQFNQNTKAKVDEDKKHRDRLIIKKVASDLGINWSTSKK